MQKKQHQIQLESLWTTLMTMAALQFSPTICNARKVAVLRFLMSLAEMEIQTSTQKSRSKDLSSASLIVSDTESSIRLVPPNGVLSPSSSQPSNLILHHSLVFRALQMSRSFSCWHEVQTTVALSSLITSLKSMLVLSIQTL